MLQLPHGCRCSTPSIFPKNWKQSSASIKLNWRIQFYFYDPELKPNGKLIIVKAGINKLKTVSERRIAITECKDELIDQMLKGYNPITKKHKPVEPVKDIPLFVSSIQMAFLKIKINADTRLDMKSMLKYFINASDQLKFSQMPANEIRRKHIKAILDKVQEERNLSAQRYNKYRSYLSAIFSELVEMEIMEGNYLKDLKKQKEVKKLRELLSIEDRGRVENHLRTKYYSFYRFTQIFFQSGGRIKELLRIKVKDVTLQQQYYKATILKGRNGREVMRAITGEALPFWQDVLNGNPNPEHYVFSIGLVPGEKSIRREQITRRWEQHVKAPMAKGGLGITADFYSLKHLFLELTADTYDIETSQGMADHSSKLVTMTHYAIGQAARELEKKKNIKISFAG